MSSGHYRFPGDLARSLGEDATLTDILQMLEKHYGMVLMFDALSKELYSLKQGFRETVAVFGVCMLQQVQMLQSEYSGRIQQEHVEEMTQDHFYEGLNPQYWHMLTHKVDGEHPASYSDLLLAAHKLERQAKARDTLLLKTTRTGGSNITQPQTFGSLSPSRKLKGSHTFTAQSSILESIGAEEDVCVKPEGEEEAESSDEEDPETLSEIGGAEHSVRYIVHFANAVELYQRKNQNCFRCGSPDNLIRDCPKDLRKTAQKVGLNVKEGTAEKQDQAPQKLVVAQLASPDEAPKAWRHLKKFTFEPQST